MKKKFLTFLGLIILVMTTSGCGFQVLVDLADGGGSSNSQFLTIPNYLITASPNPGVYGANPTSSIDSSNFDEVLYCLSDTPLCCEPNEVYTGAIPITNLADTSTLDEGQFCLSFRGRAGSYQTAVQEYHYTIDGISPNINSRIYPLVGTNETFRLQSNSLDAYLRSTSDNFGQTDYYHTNLYLGTTDPAAFDCETIYNNYPYGTYGLTSTDGNVETIAATAPEVNLRLRRDSSSLSYGANYIVSVMRHHDTTTGIDTFACNHNLVIIEDFPLFRPALNDQYSSPVNGLGIIEFQGEITSFGSFMAPEPSSIYKLKTDFVNIIN